MRRTHPFHSFTTLILLSALAAPVLAKLPVPSPEAKAKTTETAAKTAWSDKLGAYQLCLADERTTAAYRNSAKAAGKAVPAPVETPACVNPGPYVAATAAAASAPPLEAAGAHSPPATAVGPHNSNATAAELHGHKKK